MKGVIFALTIFQYFFIFLEAGFFDKGNRVAGITCMIIALALSFYAIGFLIYTTVKK